MGFSLGRQTAHRRPPNLPLRALGSMNMLARPGASVFWPGVFLRASCYEFFCLEFALFSGVVTETVSG